MIFSTFVGSELTYAEISVYHKICKFSQKKSENYCKMGLNKRSYNFTQKQRWNKNSEIENIHFMWSGKKKMFFFGIGRNFCTNGDFSTLHILTKIWTNSPQSKFHKNFFFTIIFPQIVYGVLLDNLLSSEKIFGQYNWHKISQFCFLWIFGENRQNHLEKWLKIKVLWALDGHIISRSANQSDRNYGLLLYYLHPQYQVRTTSIG